VQDNDATAANERRQHPVVERDVIAEVKNVHRVAVERPGEDFVRTSNTHAAWRRYAFGVGMNELQRCALGKRGHQE
jgi:hypothetical protein